MHKAEQTNFIKPRLLKTTVSYGIKHNKNCILLNMEGYQKRLLPINRLPCKVTRRAASADRTARRQFQATGQPVSRTQASDAMTSRLPRYEAMCVQRMCFQWETVPLRSGIRGTELPPANILIPLERQLIALQLCR